MMLKYCARCKSLENSFDERIQKLRCIDCGCTLFLRCFVQ